MSSFNLKRALAQQAQQAENEGLVLDEQGRPKRLYHGTTHDFEAFDPSLANHENAMGKGIYLTDNPQDAVANYAGVGPDLESRINQRVDQLMNECNGDSNDKRLLARMKAKARKQLMGSHKGAVYPVQARMKNPLVLDPTSRQRYDPLFLSQEGDEDADLEENQEGSAFKLWQAIMHVGSETGVDGSQIWSQLDEKVGMAEEPIVYEVDQALREATNLLEDPDNGDLIGQEFIRKVYQRMGHDGVIMDAYSYFGPQRKKMPYGQAFTTQGMPNITPGTKHYVLFDPRSVKSIFNPKPNWNDPKLTAGIRQQAASMAEISRDPKRFGWSICPVCGGGTPGKRSKCERCNGWGALPPAKQETQTLTVQRLGDQTEDGHPTYRVVGTTGDVYHHDYLADTIKTLWALWGQGKYGRLIGRDLRLGSEKDLTDLAKDGAWGVEMENELQNLAEPEVKYISQARRKQMAEDQRRQQITEDFGMTPEELERIQKEMTPKPSSRNVL